MCFTHFSKELQRILLIIRALAKYPPLLILDEPINELDGYVTTMLVALIHKIHQKTGIVIIYVSHRVLTSLYLDKTYQLTPRKNGSVGRVL